MSAIVEVPHIQDKTHNFRLNSLDDVVECEREPRGAQWIPLLYPVTAVDYIGAHILEERVDYSYSNPRCACAPNVTNVSRVGGGMHDNKAIVCFVSTVSRGALDGTVNDAILCQLKRAWKRSIAHAHLHTHRRAHGRLP